MQLTTSCSWHTARRCLQVQAEQALRAARMFITTGTATHISTQSTYGDLPMHLSFITGLAGKKFPADYPFYPGNRLSYPFLTDSLSSTFYLLGCSLQAATILPASLMMTLCYMGVLILARDMTSGKKTALLAAALFFLNGGLGFLYDFDLAGSGVWTAEEGASFLTRAGQTVSDWFSTVSARIEHILTGYYKTPTNQPNPNNLRWSNVICDMMVPQRTLLGGWCMVIPCFYLLNTEFRARMRDPENRGRGLVLLGIWAGALPLIHTHSFLALGLASFGALCYDLIHGDPKAMAVRMPRGRILLRYLAYAAIAAALAVPQLICFTFAQAFQENSHSFLTLQFNWVNNPGGNGMRDLATCETVSATCVLLGDVNGDGVIDDKDVSSVEAHISGGVKLNGAFLRAANIITDSSRPDSIDINDLEKLTAQAAGKNAIDQYAKTDMYTAPLADAKRKNPDAQGYITLEGTNISYPIMYGQNWYYNDHDIDRKSTVRGSIYFYWSKANKNIVITGHNSRTSGTMFHQLHDLQNGKAKLKTFKNRIWCINTYGQTGYWEVWAMYEEPAFRRAEDSSQYYNANWPNTFNALNEQEKQAWINYQLRKSELGYSVNVTTSDRFMTLITCGDDHAASQKGARLYFFLRWVGND